MTNQTWKLQGNTWRRLAAFAVVLAAAILPASGIDQARNSDQLGAGDQVIIRAMHVAEISDKPIRIGDDGTLQLPLIGRIKAAGLTVNELSDQMRKRLAEFLVEPEVAVELVEMKSHPVSVIGALVTPGVYQLHGQKRLLEMISGAGGLRDDAGSMVRITRVRTQGALPLAAARLDATGEYFVGEVRVSDLMSAKNPAENILVRPDDVISIPRGRLVYVMGEVRKPGGFVLREQETLSVLQALALSEGLMPTAGRKNARILRPTLDAGPGKKEIPVDIASILSGKTNDMGLQPDDVLFIPNSAPKSATLRAVEAAVQIGTGVVIWRR
ncbi:polysaccharide biosynthesis/export family protein [Paludibaculum fermentans]|uniref:Polysaccharide biosynthesis/export family protein n=1 Tax=Paludibaculum fermentans TaxID=1473598 RepID=A0A7S7NW74_PALFE|nr:polysaccharide biosynthesis/export family protein [Paludibaculum fermentans]QOY90866.1 polysaccharide biosynthesis/export family protein [Paludibaculum fermentans]